MRLNKLLFKYNRFLIIVFDLLLVSFSFLILAWTKPETKSFVIPFYANPFLIYLTIWLTISFMMGKYDLTHFKKPVHLLATISLITFTILSVVSILLFAFKLSEYSRIIVFGTILLSTLFEFISFRFIYSWIKEVGHNCKKQIYKEDLSIEFVHTTYTDKTELKTLNNIQESEENSKERIITKESGPDVFNYFSRHINLYDESILLTSTTNTFNIENLNTNKLNALINLKKVNDMRNISTFFNAVNNKLCMSGTFIGTFETNKQRHLRISKKFPAFIRRFIIVLDFIINQILPYIIGFRKIYFTITDGVKLTISKAEVLGRLVSCGFEIIEYKEINNLTYFIVTKSGEPIANQETSYSNLFKMARIGKDGNILYIYKFRTMYPFSEYLQDYVLRLNGYSELGKPANDFRLTKLGKFLRKYWLDELPQLINVLSGEMKLVGIRPLSRRVFEDYPEDIKKMRIKYKPGCIPPYVSLLKQGLLESIEAEREYLIEMAINPFLTDLKYFNLAVFNIITNKIRSA